jgi:TRAP-type C4-dicarboxylate transport system substrate-binding protein
MTLAMIAEASELAHYNAAQHADAEPLLALSTLPMLATSLEEAAVLLRIARPHYEAVLARHGQVLLATEPWRPATLWSTFPIRVAADIRGARFAQANSVSRPPRWHEPFARLGAAPSLYWDAELILVDGMVDGFKFPAEFGHLLELFYAAPLNVLSASRRLLDSLDEARRRLVVAAGREAERALWAFVERRVSREHREAGARRVAVAAQPPAELVAALRDAAEPDIQDWARAMGPAGGAIVAAFRRAVGRP